MKHLRFIRTGLVILLVISIVVISGILPMYLVEKYNNELYYLLYTPLALLISYPVGRSFTEVFY